MGLILDHTGIPLTEAKSADPAMFGLDWLGTSSIASSGVQVTSATAQLCAAVNICAKLISDGCSLPVSPYRVVDGQKESIQSGSPDPTFDTVVGLVHRDANPFQSAQAFRKTITRDALLTGNGFGFVNRNPFGEPVELIRLAPGAVAVETDDLTGEPVYRINLQGGGYRLETHQNILHITSGIKADDGVCGISIVDLAREDIGLALILTDTVSRVFKNNSRPGGVLTFPNKLAQDALTKIGTAWSTGFNGENQGRTAVLDNGATYSVVQTPLSENDAEKLLIQANVAICKHFNVHPAIALELGRATWANASEANKQFLKYTLKPHHEEWTSAYRRTLLTPEQRASYGFEFETSDFTQADLETRWSAYQTARSSGVMTANEIRQREGLPRLDDPAADTLGNPYTETNLQQDISNDDDRTD